jgi:Domain of unknown function (DUF4868)
MKNIDELKIAVEKIFSADVNFELFLGIMVGQNLTYLRSDLNDVSTRAICGSYVGGVRNFFGNEDLSVLPLSTIDHRTDVLIGYDLPERPVGFESLAALLIGQPEIFSFDQYDISAIKSIAVKISSVNSSIIFFKQLYPVSLVRQNQIMMMKVGDRFEYVDGDILKITNGFDVMLLDGEFFINDFKKFEKSFDFDAIAKQVQQKTAQSIIDLGLVDDVKSYLIDGHAPKRDMLRVAASEVLLMPINAIILFATSIQAKTGFKIENNRIQLNSKESVKRFVKLLNDDYLKSGLTMNDYDSLAKNKLM